MSKFINPVEAEVSQQWNQWPEFYAKYGQKGHTGIDYKAAHGSPVYAPADGIVKFEGWDRKGAGGNWWLEMAGIVAAVQHDDLGVVSASCHLSSTIVNKGQRVTKGQLLGYSGATGVVTGAHTHFEVLPIKPDFGNGYAGRIDPNEFFKPDPAPQPALADFQRVAVTAGVWYRREPKVNGEKIELFKGGDWYDFKGWVYGDDVDGNNIWFVGRYSGAYAWSGGFTDKSTRGLADLNTKNQPAPVATTPVTPENPIQLPVAPAVFRADSPFVTEVIPSPNFVEGQIDADRIIIHNWGRKIDNYTYEGVIRGFVEGGLGPHYVIDDIHFTQMIKESNRAQHAGPKGNGVGYGLELDPNGGEAMYAAVRRYVTDVRKRTGKKLPIVGHDTVAATQCPSEIDLYRCEPDNFPVVEQPSRTDEYGKQNNELLKDIIAILKPLADMIKAFVEKFNGIYK